MANSVEKEYEIEVTVTVRVSAGGMPAAKRVAKEVLPTTGSAASFDGFGEIISKAKVTGARRIYGRKK